MKKLSFLLLTVVALQTLVAAQSDKYVQAMQKNLAAMDSSKTVEDFGKVANTFERIGDAEKTQWLPYYYAGLALSTAGWLPASTDKDANAQRINAFCDKAEAATSNNADKAEILAVRNMAATQQMLVDPQSRYMTYGQSAGKMLEQAMELNSNNPRLYYLKGMSVFGTPAQFGGGKDKAKPLFEKAVELYGQEKPGQFYPHWGADIAKNMLAQCQ